MAKKELSSLEKLKEIGSRNISNTTKISVDSIEALLKEDYLYFTNASKLNRFFKILKNHYDISFDDLQERYEIVFNENQAEEVILEKTKVFSLAKINNKFTYTLIILIILVAVLISFNSKKTNDINNEPSNISEVIKEEINNTKDSTEYKVDKKTLSLIPVIQKRHKLAQNTKADMEKTLNTTAADILDRDIIIDLNQSIINITNKSISIMSNLGRIWIGTIDLETYDKRSFIVDETKTFHLYDNMIIVTGHGHITLKSGENYLNMKKGAKQYFYYKDNKFVKLKEIEYLYLNKGIRW